MPRTMRDIPVRRSLSPHDALKGSHVGPVFRQMLCVITALVLLAPTAYAQVVRGVARDASTGALIEGALITLERVDADSAIVAPLTVLSNERGEFAIRAGRDGRYRVSGKRIGVKRTLTEPFDLAVGETRQVTLELEPVLYSLPVVAVATANFCIPKRDQVSRVAALWEEVRTALTATSISVRDSLYRGRIVSFVRLLDGRGRVLNESVHQVDGLLNTTFTAVHPDTVSVYGFWREEADSVRFDAPDVDILLSAPFLRDHCFELASETASEVGIRFSPAPGRPVTDVNGTMWVDARTFELRRIEFAYTRLPRVERVQNLGGEVHFARLNSGAWVVRRWSLRVPQFSRAGFVRRWGTRADPSVVRGLGIDRVMENRMVENGGIAYIDHLRSYERPATIRGTLRDSAGAPYPAALVRLAGTAYSSAVTADGRFWFDSIPPGFYMVEGISESNAPLGVPDAELEVAVTAGDSTVVSLRGTGTVGLLTRMCGGRQVAADRTALRIILVGQGSAGSEAGQSIRLWWSEYVRQRGVNRVVQQQLDASTAADGSAIFCGLPLNVPIEVGLAIGPDRAHRLATVTLEGRRPTARTVSRD